MAGGGVLQLWPFLPISAVITGRTAVDPNYSPKAIRVCGGDLRWWRFRAKPDASTIYLRYMGYLLKRYRREEAIGTDRHR